MTEINYFHILGVAPLLGYIGYLGYNNQLIGTNLGALLIILAIIIVLYHSYLVYIKSDESIESEGYQRVPIYKGKSIN
jgi:hypothetical protein